MYTFEYQVYIKSDTRNEFCSPKLVRNHVSHKILAKKWFLKKPQRSVFLFAFFTPYQPFPAVSNHCTFILIPEMDSAVQIQVKNMYHTSFQRKKQFLKRSTETSLKTRFSPVFNHFLPFLAVAHIFWHQKWIFQPKISQTSCITQVSSTKYGF